MSTAPWLRLTGAGLELAFVATLFGGIGAVVDRAVGSERPLGLAMGGLVGFSLGMIRFIRLATQTSKAQREVEVRVEGHRSDQADEQLTPRDKQRHDK
ncbi:AtpZ/AtpI family protein [Rhodopirellula sp. MGV]|uniref:AtpZ/AtpI family protein n=1 Tax=Rhodopirellula sp. MGV TaxID=2023130 RepID=UPI000BCC286A|nr:AtpZ/AtpI family protein [Rhodopirellula sp. MGV]OYP34708.1 hypothetical protein CGZ80_13825 [Rhodopirellula sp. MGV]